MHHELADTETVFRFFMIVDDIRLTAEGTDEIVAAGLLGIVEDAVRILEGQLCMQVSRDDGAVKGKAVVQVSSKLLGKRVGPRLTRFGVNVAGKVKNLGVQFVAGAKRLRRNQVAGSRYVGGLVR